MVKVERLLCVHFPAWQVNVQPHLLVMSAALIFHRRSRRKLPVRSLATPELQKSNGEQSFAALFQRLVETIESALNVAVHP